MEPIFYQASLNLPENFAQNLLELEMQVDKNCKLEDIRSLVDLYSSAIEYYESIKNSKFQAYHKRLHNLLLREDVQNVLNSTVKTPQRKPLTNINVNSLLTADSQILSSTNVAEESSIHALTNIKSQESTLEKKIKARKSLKNSASSIKSDEDRTADFDSYENALIELMSKFLTEKISKVQKIKETYEKQIDEIKEMGKSPILIEIIKQMRVSMQIEIDEVNKIIEEKKTQEIAKVRSQAGFGNL
ncbi:hypothetical protein SteCoe_8299 [Stentor coeruleus]|uniref:Uncharacterized protein n=1 Tax=Stentor coeruleus TaxID=5963 RepID=A0A1R2CKE6_9CILI|nr:hypothetical protein SteCoe_8299 [Stentor coeruleus]